MYAALESAPKEWNLKLIYNPLDEKPYYMVGENPFTSTLKLVGNLNNKELREDQLLFTADIHYTNIALHNHEFFEYVHVVEGEIETIIDGDKVILKKGDLCLLNKKAVHSIKTKGEHNRSYNGIIMDRFRENLIRQMPANHPLTQFYDNQDTDRNYIHFKTRDFERVQHISHHMIDEYFLDKPESHMAVTGFYLILMTELIRLYSFVLEGQCITSQDTESDASIQKILRYLQQNYQHASIDSVAAYFHFNPSYMSRFIKKEIGKSFTEILKEIKLNKAKTLLENSKRSVEDIAYEVGYNSVSHFYKVFKSSEGITPIEYKNKSYKPL